MFPLFSNSLKVFVRRFASILPKPEGGLQCIDPGRLSLVGDKAVDGAADGLGARDALAFAIFSEPFDLLGPELNVRPHPDHHSRMP